MNNTRKKQIKTLGILLVAVIGLAVGFAAFSSSLNIKTRLSVNPNNGTFLVKFSKSSSTLDESDVVPTKSSDIFTAYNGEIDNTGIPTISNLGGQFTQPGETITYDFYTLNTGSYNAYLTDVIFNNVEGETVNKVCTSVDGTHQSEVDEACKGISIKVIMGIDTIINTRSMTGHTLAPNESEPVRVVIEYSSTAVLPEVEFTVDFGTISMIYNSLEAGDITVPQQNNVWYQRGLTSSNVVYDKQYYNSSEDESMGVYSNGGALLGDYVSKAEIDLGIEEGDVIVGDDYVLVYMGVYGAIVFDSPTSVTVYLDFDSVEFTKTGIINNSDDSMVYTLINDDLPDPSEFESSSSPSEAIGFSTCYLSSDEGTSGISQGDRITCGSEGFYAIADPSNGKVAMLSEYALNTTSGYQSENNATYLPFWDSNDSYGYWTNGSNDSLNSNFSECSGESYCTDRNGISYPVDVYGISNSSTSETSSLKTYIDSYAGSLTEAVSGSNATGRLITYDELINLGCTSNSCTNAPAWVYTNNYWTGFASSSNQVWNVNSNGDFIDGIFSVDYFFNLRPVIEISTSAILVS